MRTIPRSLLFVPGDNPDRIGKAAISIADGVIIDLEDAVLPEAKTSARSTLALAARLLVENAKFAVVRVNAYGKLLDDDLAEVLSHPFDAIMVPKVESAAALAPVNAAIARCHHARDRDPPSIIALIESARGVLATAEIAATEEVSALALGTEDLSLSMGVKPEPDVLDLPVRMLALAACAHDKAAYAMPLSIAAFRDHEATAHAARLARNYGCHGALCIHPSQAAVVNDAFAPTEAEVAEAQAALRAWDEAEAAGKGVAVFAGKMIDAPVVSAARKLVAAAAATASGKGAL